MSGIARASTLGSSRGAASVSVGTHTLRIAVAGTAGHARVDVDALEIVR